MTPRLTFNSWDSYRFLILGKLASTAIAIFKVIKLPAQTLRTGFFEKKIKKEMRRIYQLSELMKNRVSADLNLPSHNLEEMFEISQRALKTYKKVYYKIERIHFLKNSEIQALSENTLSNFYAAERITRNLYFDSQQSDICSTESNLVSYATEISLSSL